MGVDDRTTGGMTESLNRIAVRALFLSDNQVLVVEQKEGWHCLPGCKVSREAGIIDQLRSSLAKQLGIRHEFIEVEPETLPYNSSQNSDQLFFIARLRHAALEEQESKNYKWIDIHDLEKFCLSPSLDLIRRKLTTASPA